MSTTMTTTAPNSTQTIGAQANGSPTFSPRFDIWEGENEYLLYGDLPGVDADNLEIHFENRQLTIHGKVCRNHDGRHNLLSEYGVGDFQRVFTVGEAIDYESISAELRDGVLMLRLPKPEEAKPRRIEVRAS